MDNNDKKEYKNPNELSNAKAFFMIFYCIVLLIACFYIREWLYG